MDVSLMVEDVVERRWLRSDYARDADEYAARLDFWKADVWKWSGY